MLCFYSYSGTIQLQTAFTEIPMPETTAHSPPQRKVGKKMTDETKSLAVLTDETGYTYDLTCLPDQSSPLIAQASNEILQDM